MGKTLIVLSGAPCTGKTKWVRRNLKALSQKYNAPVTVLSRDQIRKVIYDNITDEFTLDKESDVFIKYDDQIKKALSITNIVIVLDNTHLRESYFYYYQRLMRNLPDRNECQMFIKFFKAPFWLIRLRNFWRCKFKKKCIKLKYLKEYQKRSKNVEDILVNHFTPYLL